MLFLSREVCDAVGCALVAAASMAIAAGSDVKLVQQMLGHADATETLNTYSHLWPDRIDEISTKLDAARDAALAPPLAINVPEMSQIADILT